MSERNFLKQDLYREDSDLLQGSLKSDNSLKINDTNNLMLFDGILDSSSRSENEGQRLGFKTTFDNPEDGITVGTEGNDNLIGTNQDDIIFGAGGDDNISGLEGDDILYGGRGVDTMTGGLGSDAFAAYWNEDDNIDIVTDFDVNSDHLFLLVDDVDYFSNNITIDDFEIIADGEDAVIRLNALISSGISNPSGTIGVATVDSFLKLEGQAALAGTDLSSFASVEALGDGIYGAASWTGGW